MREENKESKIEGIEHRLYEKNDTLANRHREGVLHPINHRVGSSWEGDIVPKKDIDESNMKKPKTSIFKKFFIFSIIFFFLAAGYALYNFLGNDVSISNEKIEINVLGNGFTKGGEELPLQIEIVNRNNANLELVDLVVVYPKGSEDNQADLVYLPRENIGTIKAGESITRNIKVTLFGYEKSIRNIKISLEYHPEGSNAIFTKEKEYPITISTAPLSLVVNAPTSISPDQSVTLDIIASLNTTIPGGKTILQVSYPNNFVFESATPNPSIGNSTWDLSSITLTEPVNIEIKGRMIGQDGDKQSFRIYAGSTSSANPSVIDVTYNSYLHILEIVKPFLETHILVNGLDSGSGVIASPSGEVVDIQIPWTNNLSTKITDAEIIANLSGNAFNKSSVKSSYGFYDSANSQIIWNKNTIARLASIDPGENGTVEFSIRPISLIGMFGKIKDPQIVIDVSIKGRQPNYGSTFDDVNSFVKKTIRITTDFQIVSSAFYSAGFIPPKAEGETRYKVEWTLSNSINNVTQARAVSSLPIYVDWVGKVAGSNEKISYNEVTREITWEIGTVYPINGSGTEREVSFIISLKPSLSQVGTVPQLMKAISLTGKDEYSGGSIRNTTYPITTSLFNDPVFGNVSGQVVK